MEFLDAVLPIEQGGAFQPPLPSKFGSLAMFARDAACLILGDFSCAPGTGELVMTFWLVASA